MTVRWKAESVYWPEIYGIWEMRDPVIPDNMKIVEDVDDDGDDKDGDDVTTPVIFASTDIRYR